MKNKFLVGIFLVSVCFSVSGENSEEEAIEKAMQETDVALEQLVFEKTELISSHLQKGEEFLVEGKLDEAEAEFKAVLEVAPHEERATAYLRNIKNIREKIKRGEEYQSLVEEEKKKALAELEKRKKERDDKVTERRRARTKTEWIQEYILSGKEYYEKGEYTSAIEEWQKVLELTSPSDRDYLRILNWIEAAKLSEEQKRERTALEKKKEAGAMIHRDVKEGWSIEEGEIERIEEAREEVEEEISPAKLRLQARAREPITITFEDAHLRTVLREMSSLSGINIVLDENVFPILTDEETKEERITPEPTREEVAFEREEEEEEEEEALADLSPRVTIRLKDVPLIEALDIILRTKGLNFRIEENIIWITTEENLAAGELITKTHRPSGGIGEIVNVLRASVPSEDGDLGGPAGSKITVDRTSGTIIITNTPANQRIAEDIIRKLSTTPPQASIETRFVDIDTDTLAQLGIQWEIPEPFEGASADSYIGGTDFDLSGKPTSGPGIETGGVVSSGISIQYSRLTPTKFEAVVQALESSGQSNLLSVPKITVLNNYNAKIEVIRPYPYIESYSLEEETIEIGGDDFKITTAVPEVTHRDVGVILEVIPGIGADKKLINLTLAPQVIELADWLEFETPVSTLRQPIFSVRYVTTNVDINDGETLVLGGLVRGEDTVADVRIPFLGRIPIIGSLFRSKAKASQERELLIFVTAIILEPTGQPLIRD